MIAVTNSSKVFSYISPLMEFHILVYIIYIIGSNVCNAKGTLHHNHYLISPHSLLML